VVDRDVDLFIAADVGSDGSDPNVPGKPEERQEDEENGSFKDGGLQDGVIGMSDPGVTDAPPGGFILGVGAVGVDHKLQGLIVALLVGHVGLEGCHHTVSGWKVTRQPRL
jgi:hypothetical protein